MGGHHGTSNRVVGVGAVGSSDVVESDDAIAGSEASDLGADGVHEARHVVALVDGLRHPPRLPVFGIAARNHNTHHYLVGRL